MDEEFFDKHIKAPFNEAWACLTPIRDSNDEAAWQEYMNRTEELYKRLGKAKSVREIGFLRSLYHLMIDAGKYVEEARKENERW